MNKKKSGRQFRKEKQQKDEIRKDAVEKMHKIEDFFKQKSNIKTSDDVGAQPTNEQSNDSQNNSLQSDAVTVEINLSSSPSSSADKEIKQTDTEILGSVSDDPSKWNRIGLHQLIKYFIQNQQDVHKLDLSKSVRQTGGHRRACLVQYFFMKKINGEFVQRRWMYYSETHGKIYCIYCKLCGANRSSKFVNAGFDDWQHTNIITQHESSKTHCEAAKNFTETSKQIGNLNQQLMEQINEQIGYWKQILKRIVDVIIFLTSRGQPLYGRNQHLGNSSNGNFLGILELLAQYDPLVKSHLEDYGNKGKGSTSYLSVNIVNEFLHLIANNIRYVIKREIILSKYFSLIVDSTQDITKVDQLVINIRYVGQKWCPVERFLCFLPNAGHKGLEMEDSVLAFLQAFGIDILNCRGQSYDNAANMSGKYKGLQIRIIEKNVWAIYVPCTAHSLNLIICHAVETSDVIVRFFLFVQNIYTFFAASTKRWDMIEQRLKKDLLDEQRNGTRRNIDRILLPKKLSDTRWSCRADACKALQAGYHSFIEVLNEISQDPDVKMITRIEAESLHDTLLKPQTAFLVEFWADLFGRANSTSKSLQSPSIDIQSSIKLLTSFETFCQNLRDEDTFNSYVDKTKSLLRSCDSSQNLELMFESNKRKIKRNVRYDIGNGGPEQILDNQTKFRTGCIYTALDSILVEIRSRLTVLKECALPFDFLFNLDTLNKNEIRSNAETLRKLYYEDLDEGLYNECLQFQHFVKDLKLKIIEDEARCKKNNNNNNSDDNEDVKDEKVKSLCSKLLKFMKDTQIEATFPNVEVALRIYETIPFVNASAERSFSSMKYIKDEHRNNMTQEHLNDFATLFMNKDLLKDINFEEIIDSFVREKARRKVF